MKFRFLLVICLSTVVLTACAPPNPQGSAPDTNLTPTANQNDEDLLLNDLPYSDQNSDARTNQNQLESIGQNSMSDTTKTLQDFEQIPATTATITTTKGVITFTLYRDKAPLTTANFLNLAKQGFYNGIVFHRVIPDFMAQVGDPLTKDPSKQQLWGTGGPGYAIADEFNSDLKHDSPGVVSMANSGPNTGGSQFFITYEATPWLDNKHAVFGKVTSGMDVLEQIEVGDKIVSVTFK